MQSRLPFGRFSLLLFPQDEETTKEVTLYIRDDEIPEDDETLLVELVPDTDGVRVARPSTDDGRKVNPQRTDTTLNAEAAFVAHPMRPLLCDSLSHLFNVWGTTR